MADNTADNTNEEKVAKTAADYRDDTRPLDIKDDVIRITDGRKFLVSTVHLKSLRAWGIYFDYPYESMVFAYDPDGLAVSRWTDYYSDRYDTEDEACEGHAFIVGQLTAGLLDMPYEQSNDEAAAYNDEPASS